MSVFSKRLIWLSLCLLFLNPDLYGEDRLNDDAYDSRYDGFRLETPTFSQEHGYYDQAFELTISGGDDGCIYYTTDGSEPGFDNGRPYTQPIRIEHTTVLRARCLSKDEAYRGSRITTATYLFVEDILHQSNRPEGYPSQWGPYATLSGSATADYEMDPELMKDKKFADKVREGLKSLPVVSLVTDRNYLFNPVDDAEKGGIYMYTDPPTGYTKTTVKDPGIKWIRPTSVEYFNHPEGISWQADCGLRLHGGHSRLPEKTPKHSFRLAFKEEYGQKNLKYTLFDDSQANKLDNIILRAGFGNTWLHQNYAERKKAAYTRDAWTKRTQAAMGHPASHVTYAHLFINGLYWGIYTPTEHIDGKWCSHYFGDNETDYDIIKVEDNPQNVYAGEGDVEAWKRLFKLSEKASDNKVFRQILGQKADGSPDPNGEVLLDVDNFIDYMILNIYGANSDWDRHNWLAFRSRIHPEEGFRMICWDSEQMLKSVNGDVGYGEMRSLCPSTLFGNLMKNKSFCELVDERLMLQCFNGGPLTPERARQTWDELSEPIQNALYAESARWGDYRRDVHSWQSGSYELCTVESYYLPVKKDVQNNILPKRRDVFISQMRKLGFVTAVEQTSKVPEWSVAQNPVRDQIELCGDFGESDRLLIRVFDLEGRCLIQQETAGTPHSYLKQEIPIPSLENGLYILKYQLCAHGQVLCENALRIVVQH